MKLVAQLFGALLIAGIVLHFLSWIQRWRDHVALLAGGEADNHTQNWPVAKLRTALRISSVIVVVKAILIGLVMYKRAAILGY